MFEEGFEAMDDRYERFMDLCEKKGVTAYKVAKETGLTTATLSNWKNGRYTPKAEKMQKIADFFGVSFDYLMTGKTEQESAAMTMLHHAVAQAGSASPFLSNHGQMTWIDDDELYMIETVHNWSEAQKKKLRKYIETINEYIGEEK